MGDIGLMIEHIDAHLHVWDLAVRDQPWMTGDGMDPLRRNFDIDQFVTQARARPSGQWLVGIRSVAQCDNVSSKISGLVTEADWSAWIHDDVRPYLDHALAVFGADRLLFGSDWPVCTVAASYECIVNLAETFTGSMSTGEQAAVFGGNAAEIYSFQPFRREAP